LRTSSLLSTPSRRYAWFLPRYKISARYARGQQAWGGYPAEILRGHTSTSFLATLPKPFKIPSSNLRNMIQRRNIAIQQDTNTKNSTLVVTVDNIDRVREIYCDIHFLLRKQLLNHDIPTKKQGVSDGAIQDISSCLWTL